jgi:hypothetical protein
VASLNKLLTLKLFEKWKEASLFPICCRAKKNELPQFLMISSIMVAFIANILYIRIKNSHNSLKLRNNWGLRVYSITESSQI